MPKKTLLGVQYDVVSRPQILQAVETAAQSGQVNLINNINVHAMNLMWDDAELKTIINNSDFVFVDGVGIRWGSICAGQGADVGERSTPRDFIEDIFAMCGRHQWPIFHLGDTDEVNADFAAQLAREYPDCPLAGCHHGFFDRQGAENDAVIERINNSGAKILLVGMSMPIQEKWAWHNRGKLQVPVVMAVGGLIRVYTGHIARGPKWMTDNGMEWLYRLAVQRQLVWRRYVIGNPLFLWRAFCSRFKRA